MQNISVVALHSHWTIINFWANIHRDRYIILDFFNCIVTTLGADDIEKIYDMFHIDEWVLAVIQEWWALSYCVAGIHSNLFCIIWLSWHHNMVLHYVDACWYDRIRINADVLLFEKLLPKYVPLQTRCTREHKRKGELPHKDEIYSFILSLTSTKTPSVQIQRSPPQLNAACRSLLPDWPLCLVNSFIFFVPGLSRHGIAGISDDLISPCCPVCCVVLFQSHVWHTSETRTVPL